MTEKVKVLLVGLSNHKPHELGVFNLACTNAFGFPNMEIGVLNLGMHWYFCLQNINPALIIYGRINSMAAVLSKLKTQWSKATPKDPKTASDQNFLNTPKEPLAKDLFTQVSSKSIELCRRRSVLSIFEQLLKTTPRWPLTPNSWTPLLSPHPHLLITVSKYHENPSRRIREEAFSNTERTDR